MIRAWHLRDAKQSLVLASSDERLPVVAYWGAALPEGENLEALARLGELDVTGGMLDRNPETSLCPQASQSFPGHVGLMGRTNSGAPLLPEFRFREAEGGDTSLTMVFIDEAAGLELTLLLSLDARTSLFKLQTVLESIGNSTRYY